MTMIIFYINRNISVYNYSVN